jgi:hypothetical protein
MDLFSRETKAYQAALYSEACDIVDAINRQPGWRADQPTWGLFDNGKGWISVVAWHKRTKLGYVCRNLEEWRSYRDRDDAWYLQQIIEAEERSW